MFVDTAKIQVKAGKGGDGCQSYYKDKYSRYAVPNGGSGGNGGDVIIKVNDNIHTLLDFHYRHHFKAEKGSNGSSNNKKGKDGGDCIIEVPAGTIVLDLEKNALLRDLTKQGEMVVVAGGGRGGRGNSSKKPAVKGDAGEEKILSLELKLIADCGIVGFPNAGKSTLISKISKATPKIAPYPFTTKEPVLGIVEYKAQMKFKVADIPGLITDAHRGKGLGDKFLKHIERTRLLIHIIDMAGCDGRDPVSDYHSLNRELKAYGGDLDKRPQILVGNKMDMQEAKVNLERFVREAEKKILPVSALTGEGLNELIETIAVRLNDLNER